MDANTSELGNKVFECSVCENWDTGAVRYVMGGIPQNDKAWKTCECIIGKDNVSKVRKVMKKLMADRRFVILLKLLAHTYLECVFCKYENVSWWIIHI